MLDLQQDVTDKFETINRSVGEVRLQVDNNEKKMEEIQQKELINIREELENLRNRPVNFMTNSWKEEKEMINFKEYRKNPVEFLGRIDDFLKKNKINTWNDIRNILDEAFRGMLDNWWIAVRAELTNYEGFIQMFKSKYWSESIQNIIRDNLCHGRYEPNRGQSPTAYFLGKVCVARNLDPRIPEECLVTKLSYHFEEGIIRARLCGQVKSINAMEALLASYELEEYYKRSRRQTDRINQNRDNQNQIVRNKVNHVRYDNNRNDYNRSNNNNERYYNTNNNSRNYNNNNNNYYRNRQRRRSFNDDYYQNREERSARRPRNRSQEERSPRTSDYQRDNTPIGEHRKRSTKTIGLSRWKTRTGGEKR